MLGNVARIWLLSLLVGCSTVQAPRLVVRGWVTLDEGERRGALGAVLHWVTVPRRVPQPLDPVPPAWPSDLAGRVECVDAELCNWERRARLAARRIR